jgi:hypothetical protein
MFIALILMNIWHPGKTLVDSKDQNRTYAEESVVLQPFQQYGY